jgi:hypothetical protein
LAKRIHYCKIPLRLITIEGDGYHLMVSARVNGLKANMLVDTGASKTVFDVNRIRKFLNKKKKKEDFQIFPQLSTGLGTNNLESRITSVDKFQIGKYTVPDFPAILLDLTHVNQSYEMLKIKPIDGVIGSDLLFELKAQINYSNRTLKIFLK